MKVCISAGHGLGSRTPGVTDPGAVGFGYQEATIVKGMARRLSEDFAAIGWPVLFRDTGHYAQADNEAAAFNARFFMELHTNASVSNKATGVEVLVGPDPTDREKKLARTIRRGIANATGLVDRGTRVRRDLAVLKQYGMDSVLVELFFISNASDLAAYQSHVDQVELNILNAVLWSYGFKTVPSLPRNWGKPRRLWAALTYR